LKGFARQKLNDRSRYEMRYFESLCPWISVAPWE
jgi:hypothetical protein